MTSVFSADGKNVPCTVIEAGSLRCYQVKTVEKMAMKLFSWVFRTKGESTQQNREWATLRKQA